MKTVWNVAGELALDAAHAWPLVRDALSTVVVTRAETLGGLALVVAFECERDDVCPSSSRAYAKPACG